MKHLASCFVAAFTLAACAEPPAFKGGLWKEIVYDKPSDAPVVFSGMSRSTAACAPDYCIYLDMWYDDDTPVWGVRAEWSQGTHGWERTAGAFVPAKPIKKIQMFAFLRKGTGLAEFKDLALERREGTGDVIGVKRMTDAPFSDADRITLKLFVGRKILTKVVDVPGARSLAANPLRTDEVAVWTCDSMRRVTPLTFPKESDRSAKQVSLELARRERESFQIQISTGALTEWKNGGVALPVLRNEKGEALKGTFSWQRIGYVAREPGYFSHPNGVPSIEKWLPDPLLPPAPYRVRAGSTQGLWFTVLADQDAKPGVYSGDIAITEAGRTQAVVRVEARVRGFAQPATFGMPTAFCVMDGFTRAQYPDSFAKMKRQSWDIMLDHRLNPDDISRTTPPTIEDLLYARSRGMNRFNILNIVPQPKNPNVKWVCYSPPSATEDPAFYPAFKARLDPYVAELRRHGLEKFAYIYGFDERQKEYYPGIDALWRKLKRDFPEIPVMTTAMMYRDMVKGHTEIPCLMTTDWYCPLTPDYNLELSEKLRRQGKQVWWYTCCGPQYPYANMSSLEYPWIEGRLLGWMTHLYRADGLLFWHVNYWNNSACIDENDTFFPSWHTYSGLHMPGDGIFLYPGKTNILPSIRLAQVRDGVEDYEWLQLAAAKAGPDAADAESRTLIQSMTKFSRDPATLRAARSRLADVIEKKAATP